MVSIILEHFNEMICFFLIYLFNSKEKSLKKLESLIFRKNIIETFFGEIGKVFLIPKILQAIKNALIYCFCGIEKRVNLIGVESKQFSSLVIFILIFIFVKFISGAFSDKLVDNLHDDIFDFIERMLSRFIIFFEFFNFSFIIFLYVFVQFVFS